MIVLDTNMLDAAKFPHSALLLMLEMLAKHHKRPLAVPEMVQIEHVAHHRREVEEALKAARAAIGTLGAAFGEDLGNPLLGRGADDAAQRRTHALGEHFKILPIPVGAAVEALTREANRRPPAERQWRDEKGDKVKARGARDAVIWLTLLETAKTTAEPIWFFSEDKDFADNGNWHPDLQAEAAEVLGEKAPYLQLVQGGFPALLKRLAEPADLQITELEALLQDEAVADAVRNSIAGPLLFFDLAQRVLPRGHAALTSSPTTQLAFDKRMDKPQAYKVGELLWVTGRVQWSGRKQYTQIQANDVITEATSVVPGAFLQPWSASVDFTFATTVLLLLHGDTRKILELHVLAPSPFVIERPPQVSVSVSDTLTVTDELIGTAQSDEPNPDEERES